MDAVLLKKLLGRFRKDELIELGQEWGQRFRLDDILSGDGARSSKTKRGMVSTITKECKRNTATQQELEDLDLLCVRTHSRSKLWKAFRLLQLSHGSTRKVQSPKIFERRLQTQLDSYFSSSVRVQVKDHAYWVRVCVQEDGARGSHFTSYVVHRMNTNSLVVANLSLSNAEYLLQAFATVLGASDVEDMTLQGHCVRSLIQLTANKNHQGVFSKRHLGSENPLILPQSNYKHTDKSQKGPVVNENWQEKQHRESLLEEGFGSDPQPTLEKVEYKLETKFAGVRFAPAMIQHTGVFRCQVKFEGSSVIQGIQNLGKAGLAELPMRDHLGKIHCLAQNKFLLRKKTQNQSSQA